MLECLRIRQSLWHLLPFAFAVEIGDSPSRASRRGYVIGTDWAFWKGESRGYVLYLAHAAAANKVKFR